MTKDTKGLPANRRDVIAGATLAAAAVATTASAQTRRATPARPPVATEAPRANVLGGGATGQIFWTVQTTSGRVEGIANGKVKCFKGIPYGAPTGGLNRFMPPKPPVAWKGVKNCHRLYADLPADAERLCGRLRHDDRLGPPRRPGRHG